MNAPVLTEALLRASVDGYVIVFGPDTPARRTELHIALVRRILALYERLDNRSASWTRAAQRVDLARACAEAWRQDTDGYGASQARWPGANLRYARTVREMGRAT